MSNFNNRIQISKEKIEKMNKWIFIFYFLLNFVEIKSTEYICKINNNNDLSKTNCFNDILILNNKKYRSGHFVTTKSGELIIEYSEDDVSAGGRLFYRLTKDNRGYYEDGNPIREFTINYTTATKDEDNKDINCNGRFEARNILVNLENDSSGKDYLFSTSSWYSYSELHDIESGEFYAWLTSDFLKIDNKYIFSFQYDLLEVPGQSFYFLIYIQYLKKENGALSDKYVIKKFKLNGFSGTNPYIEIKNSTNEDNENSRTISALILEDKQLLVVLYLKKNGGTLNFKTYDYNLDNSVETNIGSSSGYAGGTGYFFRMLALDNNYIALIYFPDSTTTNCKLKLYQYTDSFVEKINEQLNYRDISSGVVDNEFCKIDNNRLFFASKKSKLYIYLIDLFNNYQTLVIHIYDIELGGYNLDKEMTAYYFNNHIFYTSTVNNANNNVFSILIIFGYANGKDSYIDISPYLSDSNNTDTSKILFDYFLDSIVINNNLFAYDKVSKVKLVKIPPELELYVDQTKLVDGSEIENNPKILQNANLLKTHKNYSLYYQLYVKEPDYQDYISNAHDTKCLPKVSDQYCNLESIKTEYESRAKPALPGRSIRVDFELCHQYCETCNIIGVSIHNQYCVTCLEPYRYDYWSYFDAHLTNCVPEGYFNDRETGRVEQCTFDNSKFYYNTTDGKRYCFKSAYNCPPPYPWLNETTHECLNISLPTTIITTIPTTIITTIPTTIITTIPTTITTTIPTTIITTIITTIPTTIITTIPTTVYTTVPTTIITTIITTVITTIPKYVTTIPTTIITTIPMTTIPRIKCNYYLLIEEKCDFTDDSNTEIYEQLKYDVVETYPKGGNSTGVKISEDLYFELTTAHNQLSLLNGTNSNNKNLSIIDLGECEQLLITRNNLPEDTDLIILKLDSITSTSKEKSVQYEVYAPGNHTKLDLSVCSSTKIDILYPIELDEETIKIYNDLKNQGYDLFNRYDKFYKDICTPYKSADGTDVILADRNNDFFAKYEIICQTNCDYSSFSPQSSYVKCECDVVEKDRIEAEEPQKATTKRNYNSIIDILKYTNYKVLWCYKLVFRGVTFYKNLGSIFTMLYFIGYCISFGFFCYKGLKPLKLEIAKLFKKKRNISNFKFTNPNDYYKNKSNLKNNTDDNDKDKNKKVNIIAGFKSNDLIDPDKNKNLDNKSTLKRSIKNKKVQLIDIDENDIKKKENLERTQNMTYSKNNNKENIVIKNYQDKTLKTKNSKEAFPPKRKDLLNSNFDNKLSIDKLKSDSNSDKIFDNDIVIYKSNNLNNQKDTKDATSMNKKLNQEDSLIKEDLKTNVKLKEKKKGEIGDKRNKDEILSDYELNHLEYSEALELDNRFFLTVYWSHLKREHPIIHTFFAWNDFNLFFIKLSNFFFLITTVMSLDALFFSNDTMHDIYKSGGSYNFGYHLVQMVLTIIVYEALQVLLNFLTLTDIDYYKIKGRKDTITQKEVYNIIQCIKYKIIGYYIFTFLVFLFYWYLNSAFCAVYEYTQSIFIVDSIVCFVFALIYPLILYLIPTGLRKISFIFSRIKVFKIVYRISQFIPIF